MKNFRMAPLTTALLLLLVMVIQKVNCECPKDKATVLTYNAALVPFEPGLDKRRVAVVEAIREKGKHVDFMCLQELWFEKDVKSVIEALEYDFPYHFSAIHHRICQLRGPLRWKSCRFALCKCTAPGVLTVPCSRDDISRLTACYVLNCVNSGNNRQRCLLESCAAELFSVPQNCRSCITLTTSMADVLKYCANPNEKFNRINNPGLLVLSRQPLLSAEYVNYLPGALVLVERGYINVQVGKNANFVCTHLSGLLSIEDDIPVFFEVALRDRFSSFEEQQFAEIRTLGERFSGSAHVLLGDLNTGPARNDSGTTVLTGELPANYDTLINELGYRNPYLEHQGQCTFCRSENPLLLASGRTGGDLAIDHVLTKQLDSDNPRRVLDNTDRILSDHFGVQMDICLP